MSFLKGLGNIAGLVKQAQQLGGRLQAVNDELKNRRVTGRAGGDMVTVEVNGLGQVLKLVIDPTLIERKDQELLEDLIPAATNQALQKAKTLHAEVLKEMAGDMEMPGLSEMLAKATESTTLSDNPDEDDRKN